MQEKLFFQLSDGADACHIVMELSGCVAWIEADIEFAVDNNDEVKEYTLTPVYLTEEEFENLPEANI